MQPQIIHSPNRPLTPAACPLITPAPPLERLDLSQTQIHPSMAAALVGASLGSVTQCIIAGNSLGDVATEDIAQVLRGAINPHVYAHSLACALARRSHITLSQSFRRWSQPRSCPVTRRSGVWISAKMAYTAQLRCDWCAPPPGICCPSACSPSMSLASGRGDGGSGAALGRCPREAGAGRQRHRCDILHAGSDRTCATFSVCNDWWACVTGALQGRAWRV